MMNYEVGKNMKEENKSGCNMAMPPNWQYASNVCVVINVINDNNHFFSNFYSGTFCVYYYL
jgi:hypothetical protein